MSYPRAWDDPDMYEDERGAYLDAMDAADAYDDWPSPAELADEARDDYAEERYADQR